MAYDHRLEHSLLSRYVVESKLPGPSMLHQRFVGRSIAVPGQGACMISTASHSVSLTPDAVRKQEKLARSMAATPHPTLLPVREFVFDASFHWMASPLPHYPTLREWLRHRHALKQEEMEWLVQLLAEGLSAAVAQCRPRQLLDASQVVVDFNDRRAWFITPDMPIFGLSAATVVDAMQTMAFNPAAYAMLNREPIPDEDREYITTLAELCCEMLGEPVSTGKGQNERYRPIAQLNAHQNSVLRAALAGTDRHGYVSMDDFIGAFISTPRQTSRTAQGMPTHHAQRGTSGTAPAAPAPPAMPPPLPPQQPAPAPAPSPAQPPRYPQETRTPHTQTDLPAHFVPAASRGRGYPSDTENIAPTRRDYDDIAPTKRDYDSGPQQRKPAAQAPAAQPQRAPVQAQVTPPPAQPAPQQPAPPPAQPTLPAAPQAPVAAPPSQPTPPTSREKTTPPGFNPTVIAKAPPVVDPGHGFSPSVAPRPAPPVVQPAPVPQAPPAPASPPPPAAAPAQAAAPAAPPPAAPASAPAPPVPTPLSGGGAAVTPQPLSVSPPRVRPAVGRQSGPVTVRPTSLPPTAPANDAAAGPPTSRRILTGPGGTPDGAPPPPARYQSPPTARDNGTRPASPSAPISGGPPTSRAPLTPPPVQGPSQPPPLPAAPPVAEMPPPAPETSPTTEPLGAGQPAPEAEAVGLTPEPAPAHEPALAGLDAKAAPPPLPVEESEPPAQEALEPEPPPAPEFEEAAPAVEPPTDFLEAPAQPPTEVEPWSEPPPAGATVDEPGTPPTWEPPPYEEEPPAPSMPAANFSLDPPLSSQAAPVSAPESWEPPPGALPPEIRPVTVHTSRGMTPIPPPAEPAPPPVPSDPGPRPVTTHSGPPSQAWHTPPSPPPLPPVSRPASTRQDVDFGMTLRFENTVVDFPTMRNIPTPEQGVSLELPPGYDVVRELRIQDSMRMVEAQHAGLGRVLVTTLNLSAEVGEVSRMAQDLITALQKVHQPWLLRPQEILGDRRVVHVVRPFPPGRTLLDHLRTRRSFSKPAAATILVAIHEAYEAFWHITGRRLMAHSLDQFWLPENFSPENPAGLVLDATQVVLEGISMYGMPVPRPMAHMARLVLYLLGHDGGSLSGGGGERFSPVPELGARINELLRHALETPNAAAEGLTVLSMLAEVTTALAGRSLVKDAHRDVRRAVPEQFRGQVPAPLNRLRLLPSSDSKQPILTITADENVWVGRDPTNSDLVTQFRPRTAVNDTRTRSISRAQLVVAMKGGQVCMRDVGSTNPSYTGGRRLASLEVVDLPTTVQVAGEYMLEMLALQSSTYVTKPNVEGWPVHSIKPVMRGACLIRPLEQAALPVEVAWIFTEVGLIIRPNGLVAFELPDAEGVCARLHYHAGCFWIEAVTQAPAPVWNNQTLMPGQVLPLRSLDRLVFGSVTLKAESYAVGSAARPL